MICAYCKEPLFWVHGKGWVHSDGEVYKTRRDPDGIVQGGHVATPVPDDDVVRRVHYPAAKGDNDYVF